MKVIMNVPDEGYSRNASCTLKVISTFSLADNFALNNNHSLTPITPTVKQQSLTHTNYPYRFVKLSNFTNGFKNRLVLWKITHLVKYYS